MRGLDEPVWALDCFSGLGGVSQGMQAAGFRTLGIDIKHFPAYQGPVLVRDINLVASDRGLVDFLQTAPGHGWAWMHGGVPCPRFSKARPTRVKDPPTDADCYLLRAFLDLKDDLQPDFWSVENVSGAVPWFEPYVGKPRFVNGPFYLWGNFPTFLAESPGLKKNMSNWGLDPETGERTWGVKKAKDGTVSGSARRSMTPLEITRPLAKAIMAEVRRADAEGLGLVVEAEALAATFGNEAERKVP